MYRGVDYLRYCVKGYKVNGKGLSWKEAGFGIVYDKGCMHIDNDRHDIADVVIRITRNLEEDGVSISIQFVCGPVGIVTSSNSAVLLLLFCLWDLRTSEREGDWARERARDREKTERREIT